MKLDEIIKKELPIKNDTVVRDMYYHGILYSDVYEWENTAGGIDTLSRRTK